MDYLDSILNNLEKIANANRRETYYTQVIALEKSAFLKSAKFGFLRLFGRGAARPAQRAANGMSNATLRNLKNAGPAPKMRVNKAAPSPAAPAPQGANPGAAAPAPAATAPAPAAPAPKSPAAPAPQGANPAPQGANPGAANPTPKSPATPAPQGANPAAPAPQGANPAAPAPQGANPGAAAPDANAAASGWGARIKGWGHTAANWARQHPLMALGGAGIGMGALNMATRSDSHLTPAQWQQIRDASPVQTSTLYR